MADSPLASLTAATAATGGLFYGTQSAADRKFTLTAAGATLAEAADAAAQRTALGVLALTGGTLTGALGITGGTVTDSTPLVAITQTWNDGTEAMRAITVDITDTASAEFSSWFRATRGGTQFMSLCKKTAWGISNMPTFEGDGSGAGQVCFNSAHGTVILARKDAGWSLTSGYLSTHVPSGAKLGWAANAFNGNVLTTADAFFMRAAAASVQMGENSATPIDQFLAGCSGVGTNIVGGRLSLSPGKSTGNAAPAKVALQGSAPGASGTTAQTLGDVFIINSLTSAEFVDGVDITFGTTTGSKIGQSGSAKLGFWGATPIVQPLHITDPTTAVNSGADTVDLTSLTNAITEIQAAITSLNAMCAATGLTAAS